MLVLVAGKNLTENAFIVGFGFTAVHFMALQKMGLTVSKMGSYPQFPPHFRIYVA